MSTIDTLVSIANLVDNEWTVTSVEFPEVVTSGLWLGETLTAHRDALGVPCDALQVRYQLGGRDIDGDVQHVREAQEWLHETYRVAKTFDITTRPERYALLARLSEEKVMPSKNGVNAQRRRESCGAVRGRRRRSPSRPPSAAPHEHQPKPGSVRMNSTKTNVLVGFLFALLLGAVYLAIHAGAAFSHSSGEYPWNPVQLLGDMLLRGTPLPKSAPVFMIVFLIVAVAAFTVLLAWRARRAANKRGNVALAHMATKAQTKVLRKGQRTAETARLHPNVVMSCGQSVGRMIGSRAQWVYQGWRETGVYVFGTGRGKTSAFVIRHCLEAPGACIMTSNKVDGVREVIAGRKGRGTVYLFDPNRIYRDDLTPDFV